VKSERGVLRLMSPFTRHPFWQSGQAWLFAYEWQRGVANKFLKRGTHRPALSYQCFDIVFLAMFSILVVIYAPFNGPTRKVNYVYLDTSYIYFVA
jgi:hypothetical protein